MTLYFLININEFGYRSTVIYFTTRSRGAVKSAVKYVASNKHLNPAPALSVITKNFS